MVSFLGIKESTLVGHLLELDYNDKHKNHLNTFQGSVIYAMAEISTGVYLEKEFPREKITTVPLLRRSTVKYSSPGEKKLFSNVSLLRRTKTELLTELYEKGKVMINMQADVFDEKDQMVFRGRFEWFVSLKPEYLKVSKT